MSQSVKPLRKVQDNAEFHLTEIIAWGVHIRTSAAPKFISETLNFQCSFSESDTEKTMF